MPAKDEKISVGETVTLYICSGAEDGDIEVPDFVGMTEKEAFSALVKLDLVPGKVTYVKDKAERGTVISQGIEKDTKVTAHTKINLTVSGGPDFDPNNPDATKPETTEPETTKPETTKPETTATTTEPETTKPKTTETDGNDTTSDSGTDTTAADT